MPSQRDGENNKRREHNKFKMEYTNDLGMWHWAIPSLTLNRFKSIKCIYKILNIYDLKFIETSEYSVVVYCVYITNLEIQCLDFVAKIFQIVHISKLRRYILLVSL